MIQMCRWKVYQRNEISLYVPDMRRPDHVHKFASKKKKKRRKNRRKKKPAHKYII